MSDTRRDLWPGDIDVTTMLSPLVILREQAALLGERTKGLVLGEVNTEEKPAEEVEDYLETAFGPERPVEHLHTLYLVAPALENYRYSLLSVRHDFQIYPCVASFHPKSEGILGEPPREPFGELIHLNATASLGSEDAFVTWLSLALSRNETKRIIIALVGRIQQLDRH